MRCRDVEALATQFVDGDLDDRRASAVRGHARTCPDCAALLEDELLVAEAGDSLEPLDPPAALWGGIQARLAEEEVADAGRSWLWLWWQGARRTVATGAVAAAAVAVVAVYVARDRAERADDASATLRRMQAVPAADAAEVAPTMTFEAQLAEEIRTADARYRHTIASLREIVAEGRETLPEDRRAVMDQELARVAAEVERLQGEVRGAVAPEAYDPLFAAYRVEIAALQDAAFAEVPR